MYILPLEQPLENYAKYVVLKIGKLKWNIKNVQKH